MLQWVKTVTNDTHADTEITHGKKSHIVTNCCHLLSESILLNRQCTIKKIKNLTFLSLLWSQYNHVTKFCLTGWGWMWYMLGIRSLKLRGGLGCSSVVGHMLSMSRVLGLIPRIKIKSVKLKGAPFIICFLLRRMWRRWWNNSALGMVEK
jgi:hypothetical protein